MLGQLRFLKAICLLVLIVCVPYALWCAVSGSFIFAAVLAVIDIVAFLCLVVIQRAIRQILDMKSPHVDKDITPV